MLWTKPKSSTFPDIILESERILLRPPRFGDWQDWATVRGKNKTPSNRSNPHGQRIVYPKIFSSGGWRGKFAIGMRGVGRVF